MEDFSEAKKFVDELDISLRKKVFKYLSEQFHIHPIEEEFNASAEVILEAIARSSDLTRRGIRGIIAEASFKMEVLENLENIIDKTPDGDDAYDFLVNDSNGDIRIQVKMQRRKSGRPMMANEGYVHLSEDKFVVETQRTRGGIDPKTGEDTRPYRFYEFDILAVSLAPSTNDWTDFRYAPTKWLLPREDNDELLLKFQPVSQDPDEDWTDSLESCIERLRSGVEKTIST